MTHGTIRIPEILDRDAVMAVLKRLNLLETGAKSFSVKEVMASLRWAHVRPTECQRFADALEQHGLIREPAPIPPRIPARLPLLNRPGETA
jgi:hypothetical protein